MLGCENCLHGDAVDPTTDATCQEPVRRPRPARILALDDGSVRVRGVLTDLEREQLELTHFDTGRLVRGWTIWWPREVRDA
jgi:hypothetical protein